MKIIIEQYIQFAIDNGFNYFEEERFNSKSLYHDNKYDINKICFSIDGVGRVEFIRDNFASNEHHTFELITSKPFIEAIARGISKKRYFPIMEKIDIEYITTEQAFAIRDNTLEEFITNLGILGQQEKL